MPAFLHWLHVHLNDADQIEFAHEQYRPDRIIRLDIVLDPSWKQAGLLAALAAFERAIRHETNRTLKSEKCPRFLPSLDVLPS